MSVISTSVCVYCGSRDGHDPAYAQAADGVGKMLAHNGWRLVYGAGDVGLMGRVARSVQAQNGDTLGVIPAHLMQREVGKTDLGTLIVTETMHERKKVMITNAQVVVVLPGGAGSLDEFFEALTWRQIGLHDKPIYLLNTDGFWDPLCALLAHIVDEKFAEQSLIDFVTVVETADALEKELQQVLG